MREPAQFDIIFYCLCVTLAQKKEPNSYAKLQVVSIQNVNYEMPWWSEFDIVP